MSLDSEKMITSLSSPISDTINSERYGKRIAFYTLFFYVLSLPSISRPASVNGAKIVSLIGRHTAVSA